MTVRHPDGSPAQGALVYLNALALGQDYWRTLIGLTDSEGSVTIERERLKAQFSEELKWSLMDLRTPLAECDDEVIVGVDGGAGFADRQRAVLEASWLAPYARPMWQGATNAVLSPTRKKVSVNGERRVNVELTTG